MTLNDWENIIKLNLSFGKSSGSFEGINYETGEILCFCKDCENTGQKSISDGFSEGFINYGKNFLPVTSWILLVSKLILKDLQESKIFLHSVFIKP